MNYFKGITVYYLEANPSVNKKPGVDLLYLHGAAFSSHDWNRDEPSIIQMSAASGYRSVAIDIPGFSYSRSRGPSVRDYGKFLASLVEVLSIHKPVIISASASGSYSVPYVFQNQDKITGFVPVGICCTQNKNWETFSVPTLIIYGSQDRASISRKLLNIPNKNLVIIADAPHAAYIRKPLDFMTALINFMNYIHPKHDSNLLNTIFTAKIYA
ncbi:unnamed protein product [Thelazia callipaeda]|uniref:AB hydrolase-1 domain-containing protein n=1 Tax=Thelazia callipaeda TaxID=103827 RepID=A0A0N5D781_THECL|nr:unnamed protein product [Thelazia callipaeda]